MKAWRLHQLGEPEDVLVQDDLPSLDPRTDEVIVEMAACGLNFSDVLLCRGEYQVKPPLPFTPGTEIAGTVIAVGADVDVSSGLGVGARVLGRAMLPDGGLAEEVRVPARHAYPLPDLIDDATAAALHVTYQTAWFGLHHRARIVAGETLLVLAGAGGTGSAAIQLGVAAGARVLATARGATKTELCRRLGADVVIDQQSDDLVTVVREATGGTGADVVFDPVGGDLFDQARRCVSFEGRLVVVGFASGRIADAPMNHLMVKNYSLLGLHWPGYEERRPDLVRAAHDEIVRLHHEGHVRPVVSETVPFEEVPDRLAALGAGRTTGKVVVVR